MLSHERVILRGMNNVNPSFSFFFSKIEVKLHVCHLLHHLLACHGAVWWGGAHPMVGAPQAAARVRCALNKSLHARQTRASAELARRWGVLREGVLERKKSQGSGLCPLFFFILSLSKPVPATISRTCTRNVALQLTTPTRRGGGARRSRVARRARGAHMMSAPCSTC